MDMLKATLASRRICVGKTTSPLPICWSFSLYFDFDSKSAINSLTKNAAKMRKHSILIVVILIISFSCSSMTSASFVMEITATTSPSELKIGDLEIKKGPSNVSTRYASDCLLSYINSSFLLVSSLTG